MTSHPMHREWQGAMGRRGANGVSYALHDRVPGPRARWHGTPERAFDATLELDVRQRSPPEGARGAERTLAARAS